MAKKTARIAWPASMLAKRRTASDTRRKTSLTAWITKMSCLSTGGALAGAQFVEVAHGPVLADAGVVREDEGEQRQAEGARTGWPWRRRTRAGVLGERQRDEPDEVARLRTKKKTPAMYGNHEACATLHDRADDAVASELVERLDGDLEARGRRFDGPREDDRDHDQDGGGEPEVDDRLGDREVDGAELGQLDDRVQVELLGDRELLLLARRDDGQREQRGHADGRATRRAAPSSRGPSPPGGRPGRRRTGRGAVPV